MNVHPTSNETGPALRVTEKAESLETISIDLADLPAPDIGPGQVLIEVKAAGVNPSDVKASLGHMPHAVWPRIPGRDFAGIVRRGPDALVGKEVWGGGGELGITQNGTHSRWLVIPVSAVREKPSNLSFEEAGSIGVPFITAFEGLREAGGAQPWDNVVVFGANGKVGQAVIQIATLTGAKVFGVEYKPTEHTGHRNGPVEFFDTQTHDVAAEIMQRTNGRGADIIFNTVGSPYFEVSKDILAKLGRQIFISTFDRAVDFDIFRFFRGRNRFIGVDSLALDSTYGAKIFDKIGPLFEDGKLRPFPINPKSVYGFEDAADAYRLVLSGTPDRVLLRS